MQKLSYKSKIYGIYKIFGIFIKLLDLLFPNERNNNASPALNYHQMLYEKEYARHKTYARVRYFMEYKNQQVKKTLWQFKYYLKEKALIQYTYILYDELLAELSDRVMNIPFSNPIPLIHCSSSTYFKGDKTFDHMKELLLVFDTLQDTHSPFFLCCTHAILPNLETSNDLIIRAQHTGNRKERIDWASKRFVISEKFEKYLIDNLEHINTIYCIDDVVTTGASLTSVKKLFKEKFNIQVKTFCICH